MEVYKYLERHVPDSARRLKRSLQEPLLSGDISKDIVLTADRERIRQMAQKLAEAERQRVEEIRRKERKLFEIREAGALPLDAFQEALNLIEKDPGDRTPQENVLAGHLDALLRDAISAELYLSTRENLLSAPRKGPTAQKAASGRPAPPPTPVSEGGAPKFCRSCGAKVRPGIAFCHGCGKRIGSS